MKHVSNFAILHIDLKRVILGAIMTASLWYSLRIIPTP